MVVNLSLVFVNVDLRVLELFFLIFIIIVIVVACVLIFIFLKIFIFVIFVLDLPFVLFCLLGAVGVPNTLCYVLVCEGHAHGRLIFHSS